MTIEKRVKDSWDGTNHHRLVDDDGKPASDWFDKIDHHGQYYEAQKEVRDGPKIDYQTWIYRVGEKEPVSPELRWISTEGLLRGESEYYVGQKGADGKRREAIFSVKSKKPVTPWAENYSTRGFVQAMSDFCVVGNEGRDALYSVAENKRVSKWYRTIENHGRQNDVVDGANDCFVGYDDDGQHLVDAKSGRTVAVSREPIGLFAAALRGVPSGASTNDIWRASVAAAFGAQK